MIHSNTVNASAGRGAAGGKRIAVRPRELDSRLSDGIHVRLLWHPEDGRVSVAVDDAKTGEGFELPVGEGQHPLDVFKHPYAYAA